MTTIEGGAFPTSIDPAEFEILGETLIASEYSSPPPGEIIESDPAKLFGDTYFYGDQRVLIERYDDWIAKNLPKQIAGRPLWPKFIKPDEIIPLVAVILESNIIIGVPTSNEKLIFPDEAVSRGLDYMAPVKVKITFYKDVVYSADGTMLSYKEIIQPQESFHPFKLPVMVGSSLCNTRNLTSEQRSRRGLEKWDTGGYFIVGGVRRIILIQEKLALNRIFIIADAKAKKASVTAKLTSIYDNSTSQLILTINKDEKKASRNAIELYVNFFGKSGGEAQTISVFRWFRYFGQDLGLTSKESITEFLEFHMRKDEGNRRKTLLALLPSFFDLETTSPEGDLQYLKLKRQNVSEKFGEAPSEQSSDEWIRSRFDEIFRTEFFPHLNSEEDPTKAKFNLLAMMVVKLAEYMAGIRELDDRDHWGNKRLETAGGELEKLFNRLWKGLVDSISPTGNSETELLTAITEKLVRGPNKKSGNMIEQNIVNAFVTKNFGEPGKSTQSDKQIGDILNTSNPSMMISHKRRINAGANRRSKVKAQREVQFSQTGFVDPVATPESDAVGFVKYLSATCLISLNREESLINPRIARFLTPDFDADRQTRVLLNSKFKGWCSGSALYQELIRLRRNNAIDLDVGIIYDSNDDILYISSDAARPIRPLLILERNPETNLLELVIEKKQLWGQPFTELLNRGAIEFISSHEQSYLELATSSGQIQEHNKSIVKLREEFDQLLGELRINPDQKKRYLELIEEAGYFRTKELYEKVQALELQLLREVDKIVLQNLERIKHQLSLLTRRRFSHVEIDPQSLFGVSTNLAPMAEKEPGARGTFQSQMTNQALTAPYAINRYDNNTKNLVYGQRAIFETQMQRMLGSTPAGETMTVAFATYRGSIDDAITLNQDSIDRGRFRYTKYIIKRSVAVDSKEFYRPIPKPRDAPDRYMYLHPKFGFPKIGQHLKRGDIVIGARIKVVKGDTITYVEEHETIESGEEGVVDSVVMTNNNDNNKLIVVRIRQVRTPVQGDKFAARYSQKGVLGPIFKGVDMPFIERNGVIPDCIINPLGLPSRMTMGFLIELIASKLGALQGEQIDATSFRTVGEGYHEVFLKGLHARGFNPYGEETMYNGRTGTEFASNIMVGPCYYTALRHHVMDKIQARGTGPISEKTHEPIGGRKYGQAQKFGEMERDAIISHGASNILADRLFFNSGKYTTTFCKTCGYIMSVSLGARHVECMTCKSRTNAALVNLPYSLKLLSQYLFAYGISMKMTTVGEKQLISRHEEPEFRKVRIPRAYKAPISEEEIEPGTRKPEEGDDEEEVNEEEEEEEYIETYAKEEGEE